MNDFNSDIGSWDVSKVTDFDSTFRLAAAFNADLNGWQLTSATSATCLFCDSGFDCRNKPSTDPNNVIRWCAGGVCDPSETLVFDGAGGGVTEFTPTLADGTPTSVGSENGLTIATWVRRERTAIDKDYLFDCQGCDRDGGQACGAQSNKGFWMFVMFNRVLFYGMKTTI